MTLKQVAIPHLAVSKGDYASIEIQALEFSPAEFLDCRGIYRCGELEE
jgi:hypothetical protein